MKSLLTCLYVLVLCTSILAQENITVSAPYKEYEADREFYFLDKGNILSIKVAKSNVIVQSVKSGDLTVVDTKLHKDFFVGYTFEEVFEFGSKFYVIYSVRQGVTDRLLCSEIDPSDLSIKNKDRELFSVKEHISENIVLTTPGRRSNPDKYTFSFSGDSSSLVVQYRLDSRSESKVKGFDVFGLHFFNDKMEQQWGRLITMPYAEKAMEVQACYPDNKGNCFIAVTIEEELKEKRKYRWHSELVKIGSTGDAKIVWKNTEGQFVRNVYAEESPDGRMLFAGFFRRDKFSWDDEGILTFNLDDSDKVVNFLSFDFTKEILNQYPQEDADNKKYEFQNLVLKDIVFDADGSFLLTGEQFYKTEESPDGKYITIMLHFNDVIATKIAADGTLSWMKKLPKRQIGGFILRDMSYRVMRGDGCYYFFFVDHKDNIGRSGSSFPVQHRSGYGGYLSAYKILNSSGQYTQLSIADFSNINSLKTHHFVLSRIVPLSSSVFAFEVFKEKKEEVTVKVDLSTSK